MNTIIKVTSGLLLLLSFIPTEVFSQQVSWEEIYRQSVELKKKEQYKEAIDSAKEALKLYEQNPDAEFLKTVELYKHIGSLYEDLEVFSGAILNYMKAIGILESNLPEDDRTLIEEYEYIAGVYFNYGDFDNAEIYYKKILDFHKDTESLKMIEVYDKLAKMAAAFQKNTDAENYYILLLELSEVEYRAESTMLIPILNDMGNFYNNIEKYPEAVEKYERILEIEAENNVIDLEKTGISRKNLSGLYIKLEDLDAAEEQYLDIFKLYRQYYGLANGETQNALMEYKSFLSGIGKQIDMYYEYPRFNLELGGGVFRSSIKNFRKMFKYNPLFIGGASVRLYKNFYGVYIANLYLTAKKANPLDQSELLSNRLFVYSTEKFEEIIQNAGLRYSVKGKIFSVHSFWWLGGGVSSMNTLNTNIRRWKEGGENIIEVKKLRNNSTGVYFEIGNMVLFPNFISKNFTLGMNINLKYDFGVTENENLGGLSIVFGTNLLRF